MGLRLFPDSERLSKLELAESGTRFGKGIQLECMEMLTLGYHECRAGLRQAVVCKHEDVLTLMCPSWLRLPHAHECQDRQAVQSADEVRIGIDSR